MANKSLYSDGLNWRAEGYSFKPGFEGDGDFASDPEASLWQQVDAIANAAKRGDFSQSMKLLDIYDSGGALVRYVSSRLMGDIGSKDLFDLVAGRVEEESNVEKLLHYSSVLAAWGSLAVIPTLLTAMKKSLSTEFGDAYPLLLSSMLESSWDQIADRPEEAQFAAYCDVVYDRCGAIEKTHQQKNILVFRGELFSVVRIADLFLESISDTSYFGSAGVASLRRKFEASTGIDCSVFFRDESVLPLAASAAIEDFLSSNPDKVYLENKRYFFGHELAE